MDAIPGERWCARIKALCLLKIGTEIKTERIAAISQVMTGHLRWRRNPQHCMKKQERSRASFFNSQTFVMEEKRVTAAPNEASGSKSMKHRGVEEKTVCSLGGGNLARIEHPRPFHPSVRSGCCFLSSSPPPAHRLETADESQGRVCFAHSDPASHTVPVILCSQAGPGRRCPAQLV